MTKTVSQERDEQRLEKPQILAISNTKTIQISVYLRTHVACNMIYSLKNGRSWYEGWREITEAWNKLFCTVERQGNTDTIFSHLLHISTAPAFVPTSYICIATKSCLQNLFIAGWNFVKSRRSGTLCSHNLGFVHYSVSEILHFQNASKWLPVSNPPTPC